MPPVQQLEDLQNVKLRLQVLRPENKKYTELITLKEKKNIKKIYTFSEKNLEFHKKEFLKILVKT